MKSLRNTLLGGLTSLTFLVLPVQAQVNSPSPPIGLQPYIPPGPQVPAFSAGHAIVAGPPPAAFTFTGQITVTTIGSVTYGVLSVTQPANASPISIPIGSTITGGGATAGTTVMGQFPGTNNYQVITTLGTVGAATGTLTATPKLSYIIQDTAYTTAPVYNAGGCTTGPAFVSGSNVSSWTFINGSAVCTGGNTVTFTFPAAPVAWQCIAMSTLNPSTDLYIETGAASTTLVVFTDYSAAGTTPGTAQNTKANDVIVGQCTPR